MNRFAWPIHENCAQLKIASIKLQIGACKPNGKVYSTQISWASKYTRFDLIFIIFYWVAFIPYSFDGRLASFLLMRGSYLAAVFNIYVEC